MLINTDLVTCDAALCVLFSLASAISKSGRGLILWLFVGPTGFPLLLV